MSPARAELSREELYRRLEEAEEIIRAIREGEIDALVIRKDAVSTDEVFTLDGNDSYRSFMETMDIGAAAFDGQGTLLYCNTTLRSLLGLSTEAVGNEELFAVFDEVNRQILRDALASARLNKTTSEVQTRAGDVRKRFQINADTLALGITDAVAVTFTDITDRIQAERNQEAERTAMAILASAAEAVVVTDVDGVVTHANAAAIALSSSDPVSMRFGEAFGLEFRAATGLLQADDFIALALSGQSIQGVEAVAPRGRSAQDLLVSAAPLRVAENQTRGAVVTLVDLSTRKTAERQQLLLMKELDHRVKNTLALVVSISNRTASTEDTLDGFRQSFSGRLNALAATHNVLADRSWASIKLSELFSAELAPFIENYHERFFLRGDDVDILPRAAVPLGLTVHELATNAAKYGALSKKGGTIAVGLENDPEGRGHIVTWTETGGPPVSEPTRRGFGRTVIERSLSYLPSGGAEISFDATGVFCRIRIPIEDVVSVQA